MLRIPTKLDAETEALVYRVIGCCIEVHKALGPGLIEIAYERAVCIELSAQAIPFESERAVSIVYRGRPITPIGWTSSSLTRSCWN